MTKPKIIVVGNGMVGYKFCEKLIAKAGIEAFDITVFGEEIRPAYDRVHLSSYFDGKTVEDLTLAPVSWYENNHIKLEMLVRGLNALGRNIFNGRFSQVDD